MTLMIQSEPVPLKADDHCIVRVGGTRVTLDSVVYCFRDGATAEEIVQSYPALNLADVYAVLTFYLRHRKDVDEYIRCNEKKSAEIREVIEKKYPTRDLRERLLARKRDQLSS